MSVGGGVSFQHRMLEGMGILTFTVVTEAHSGLAETNGVLSLANAIELLEFCLVNTLQMYC